MTFGSNEDYLIHVKVFSILLSRRLFCAYLGSLKARWGCVILQASWIHDFVYFNRKKYSVKRMQKRGKVKAHNNYDSYLCLRIRIGPPQNMIQVRTYRL